MDESIKVGAISGAKTPKVIHGVVHGGCATAHAPSMLRDRWVA
jgi:hypothetical protein